MILVWLDVALWPLPHGISPFLFLFFPRNIAKWKDECTAVSQNLGNKKHYINTEKSLRKWYLSISLRKSQAELSKGLIGEFSSKYILRTEWARGIGDMQSHPHTVYHTPGWWGLEERNGTSESGWVNLIFPLCTRKSIFPEHRSTHLTASDIKQRAERWVSVNSQLAGWNIGFMSVGVQGRDPGQRHTCRIAALGVVFPFQTTCRSSSWSLGFSPLLKYCVSFPRYLLLLTSPKDRKASSNLQAAPQC